MSVFDRSASEESKIDTPTKDDQTILADLTDSIEPISEKETPEKKNGLPRSKTFDEWEVLNDNEAPVQTEPETTPPKKTTAINILDDSMIELTNSQQARDEQKQLQK